MQPSFSEQLVLPIMLVSLLVSINVSSVLVKPRPNAELQMSFKLVTTLKMLVSFKFDHNTQETP